MKKAFIAALSLIFIILAGCSSSASGKDTITIAWLPNESGADMGDAREEIAKVITEATGKKVEHKTTTDYNIAIEAVASGNADIAYLGAQGYIEAHKKNEKVLPLAVSTGESGTIDDAIYHSWIAVNKKDAPQYKNASDFAIDNIKGKKFSFVSNSSTSGFQVPTADIAGYFSKKGDSVKSEDLMEGGKGKFFSQVMYGGSHQGSAVNLLTGKADAAAFCDTCVGNYVDLKEGEANKKGSVYAVKKDAAEPFNSVPGKEFTLINVTPVLNAPFVSNSDALSKEDQEKIVKALTSDKVAENKKIFVPENSKFSGMFESVTGKEKLVPVKDDWFNPIRELNK